MDFKTSFMLEPDLFSLKKSNDDWKLLRHGMISGSCGTELPSGHAIPDSPEMMTAWFSSSVSMLRKAASATAKTCGDTSCG
jgi:hypothetical protein